MAARVRIEGEAGLRLVGSYAETGAWNPERGIELPAEVTPPLA